MGKYILAIPQSDEPAPVDGDISKSCVMCSAAGWYIGTTYYDEEMKGWFPYDRYTGYFRTKEEAEKLLPSYQEKRIKTMSEMIREQLASFGKREIGYAFILPSDDEFEGIVDTYSLNEDLSKIQGGRLYGEGLYLKHSQGRGNVMGPINWGDYDPRTIEWRAFKSKPEASATFLFSTILSPKGQRVPFRLFESLKYAQGPDPELLEKGIFRPIEGRWADSALSGKQLGTLMADYILEEIA